MKRKALISLVIFSFLLLPLGLLAKENVDCKSISQPEKQTLGLEIFFPSDDGWIWGDYKDNQDKIYSFHNKMIQLKDNKGIVTKVLIEGYGSAEGEEDENKKLSENRAQSLITFMKESYGLPEEVYEIKTYGADWDGLYNALENSMVPNAQKVQKIIRKKPEYKYNKKGELVNSRKKILMELDYGLTWAWIREYVLPSVEHATVKVEYYLGDSETNIKSGNIIKVDTSVIRTYSPVEEESLISTMEYKENDEDE